MVLLSRLTRVTCPVCSCWAQAHELAMARAAVPTKTSFAVFMSVSGAWGWIAISRLDRLGSAKRVPLALYHNVARETLEMQRAPQSRCYSLDRTRHQLDQHVVEAVHGKLRAVNPGLMTPVQKFQ